MRSNEPRAGASQFAEFALSTGARFEGRGGAAEAREAATALPLRAGVVASCYTGRQLLLASWLLLDEAERHFAAGLYLQVMSLLSLSFLSLSLRFRCLSSLSLSFVPRVLFFFLYVSSSVSSTCVLTSPASSSASLPTPPIILAGERVPWPHHRVPRRRAEAHTRRATLSRERPHHRRAASTRVSSPTGMCSAGGGASTTWTTLLRSESSNVVSHKDNLT